MPDAVLSVENLTAGYVKDLPILLDVNLTLKKASLTAIIGPNGAGKSTLIKSIAGLVQVSSGSIRLNGEEITHIRPDQMADHHIAYVPQVDNIFRSLTIRQNLELSLRRTRIDRASRLTALFEQFPVLGEKQRDKAGTLSGGQRQMLAVAMALAVKPSVLLLDEPSAGLSPKVTSEILEFTRGLTDQGVSILLVEQNARQALQLADHCYIFADGRNQLDGRAADMLEDPAVGEIYLGARRVAQL